MLSAAPEASALAVEVHIYDASHQDGVRKLNNWLAHKRNPLKFGGVFHAGVEVGVALFCFCSEVSRLSCLLPSPPRVGIIRMGRHNCLHLASPNIEQQLFCRPS